MIKIAHIAKPVAGVGVYINILSRYIDYNKFKNVILSNKQDNVIDIKDKSGNSPDFFDIKLEREIHIINDFKCLLKIIHYLKNIQPQLIHCHSAKAGILGRIAGAYLNIPTLYTPHAYSYLSAETKIKSFTFKTIEKAFKWFPSKTLACSESEYNRTLEDLNFNSKKVILWNNSIEGNFSLIENNLKLPSDFICAIGRPSFQKNMQLLIQSVFEVKKTISNVHFVILGVGDYSPNLTKVENLIKNLDLKDNITLIPWLKREQVLSILKISKMYVSTSRYEGLPYALLEAIALAKACVVTDVDGNQDVVSDTVNGYIAKQDAKNIASKITDIIHNDDIRKEMENASEKIYNEKFNININISLLEDIYSQQVK